MLRGVGAGGAENVRLGFLPFGEPASETGETGLPTAGGVGSGAGVTGRFGSRMSPPTADRTYDVVVVGAGPGGIAAGLGCLDAGLRPLVVDSARFPRDKTCGDGLTTEALWILRALGLDLDVIATTAPVTDVRVVSPAGRDLTLPLPRHARFGPAAAVVRRTALDAALVDHARRRGVEVRDGIGLRNLELRATEGVVTLADGSSVHARWVVAADGHYSTVRRCLRPGAPADLGTWHAARQYFSGVRERRLQVIFEADLLPGYAWVFPLAGGRANVGFGVLRDGVRRGRALRDLWPDLLARPTMRDALGAGAVPEDRVRAWPIPSTFNGSDLAHGRVLFVGDAANVVDPMTGEGIAQALTSGRLAAAAIAPGGPPGAVGARYTRAVTREIGRDLRFAGTLQRLLAHPRPVETALRMVDSTAWTRRNFARWMFEDYPRALLLTPDRWWPAR